MFKEDAWRSLEPLEKGLVLGVLAGTVLALLTWQISWIAVGVSLGIGIGHITGRRLRMQRKTGYHAQDEDSVPFRGASAIRGRAIYNGVRPRGRLRVACRNPYPAR